MRLYSALGRPCCALVGTIGELVRSDENAFLSLALKTVFRNSELDKIGTNRAHRGQNHKGDTKIY